jgi:hypothetical protein
MSRTLLWVFASMAIVYLGLCAALFIFQRSLIYFPPPRSLASKTATLALPTAEEKVLVSVRPHAGPHALIYFGGNAEDVAFNLPGFSTAFPEHALYLLHYRGYAGSSGNPSEATLFKDALALFDKVHAEHRQVVIVGRSLGSGIAVRVAGVRPATRLVLVTPYDSLQDLAAFHYPWLPVRWLLRDKYESWRYAPAVTAPTLILAAEHDEVIPRTSTERLLTRFRKGLASLKVVTHTTHNTISDSPEYFSLLKSLP